MRIVLIVLVALLTAAHASAQQIPKAAGGRNDPSMKELTAASEKEKERKSNEAAARAAMQKIPDAKDKYDPWKSAR